MLTKSASVHESAAVNYFTVKRTPHNLQGVLKDLSICGLQMLLVTTGRGLPMVIPTALGLYFVLFTMLLVNGVW